MNITISISLSILYYYIGTYYVDDNKYLTPSSRDILFTYKTAIMILRLCLRDVL